MSNVMSRGRGKTDALVNFREYDKFRGRQAVLLAAHMLWEGVPMSRVAFLVKIYPLFFENTIINGQQMAEMFGCTTENVRRYRADLEKLGYLERVNYRGWSLSETYLTQLNAM